MNEREREICSRLKVLREDLKQSQQNFAKLLGTRRDQLASIEYGRTPLRTDLAMRIAQLTGCNLVWLAEGIGPMHGPLPSPDFIAQIPPRCLFSHAWQTRLKCGLRDGAKQFGESIALNNDTQGASVLDYLIEEISGILKNLPPQFHQNFFSHMTKAGRDFVGMNLAAIIEFNASPKAGSKKNLPQSKPSLDIRASMPHDSPVQNNIRNLKELIDHLKKVTAPRGAKAALAREFKVTRQAVNAWLSGESAPSADIAIRLTNWKPKSPAK